MPSPHITTLSGIFRIFRMLRMRPASLVLPITLSILAAAFEGVGLTLLVPLLQGFFTMDFSFVKEIPVLGWCISFLPAWILRSDRWLFVALIVLFIAAMFLKNILKYCGLVSVARIGLDMNHRLRTRLFSRYLTFGKLYFDGSNVGHHTTVISSFAQQALGPLLTIGGYLNALFSLVAYLTILTVISWKLTLFALPLLALLHVAVRRLVESIRRLSRRSADSVSTFNRKAIEILSTILLVKSENMEQEEERRFSAISDLRTALDFRKTVFQSLILPLQETLTLFAILILFSGMLYIMVRDGQTTAPSFVVYFYLIVNAASKFGALTTFRGGIATVAAPVEEVLDVMDDRKKHVVPSGSVTFTGLNHSIECRNLSFVFPNGNAVLHNLSFSIARGAMTAIVGQTGAGKTTVFNLLLRFYDAPPETIFFDGADIRSYDTASLRHSMALVSQETLLLNDTLRVNITYGLAEVSDERMWLAIRQARLAEFVEGLPEGLETRIGDRGVKLSGGEKQRVAIARALLKDAGILLLDEATSSLDSRTERLIQEAIDVAVIGRTSIVIAHRLSTIKHADSIIVVEGGRVAEQGSLEELLAKKGLFYAMWEEQKFV